MNFAGLKSMTNRFRALPLLLQGEAATPDNITGYKHAGNCLVLSYRVTNASSVLSTMLPEDAHFLSSLCGGRDTTVFDASILQTYRQVVGTGPIARIINYHLVQHSVAERKLWKEKKSELSEEAVAPPVVEDADESTLWDLQGGATSNNRDDASVRLDLTKRKILETLAERATQYFDRPLIASPLAMEASLRYFMYKHLAKYKEFSAYASSSTRTQKELSRKSKSLYDDYIKSIKYTFLPYSARSVQYNDGKVFLQTRFSVQKQCRLGAAFDLNQYEMPVKLMTEFNIRPSVYVLSVNPTGNAGMYVQLVYWFKGERMNIYRSIYSQDVPGVNFFHYIPDVSVGL